MNAVAWAGLWAFSAPAAAAPKAEVHGDIKTFFVSTLPYDNELFSELGINATDPTAQSSVDGRIKLTAKTDAVRTVFHHAVTAQTGQTIAATGQSGMGVQAPQLIDLGWQGFEESANPQAMSLVGRTDRLSIAADAGPTTITIGRQPVTLGHGMAFTPMDLVNPFFPTTVDQEYKPGLDAATVDAFFGTSTQLSVIAAYTDPDPVTEADDWTVEGAVYAVYGQHTFGRHDVGLLLGKIRGDDAIGATIATYAGPVGIHADATYTNPSESSAEDPFVRAVLGAVWSATTELIVSAEVYHQSLGSTEPDGYLERLASDRHASGELWLAGTGYASTTVSYQATPLVAASASVIGNLTDGSALIAPNVAVSISDEVQLVCGGFAGLGERPADRELVDLFDPATGALLTGGALSEALGVQSEFGLYPSSLFLQMKAYF